MKLCVEFHRLREKWLGKAHSPSRGIAGLKIQVLDIFARVVLRGSCQDQILLQVWQWWHYYPFQKQKIEREGWNPGVVEGSGSPAIGFICNQYSIQRCQLHVTDRKETMLKWDLCLDGVLSFRSQNSMEIFNMLRESH